VHDLPVAQPIVEVKNSGFLAASDPLTVTLLNRWEDIAACADEWQQLLTNCQQDSLFLATSWMEAWAARYAVKQLFFITVRDANNHLVSMAPLQISLGRRGLFRRTVRSLQFMGTEPDVYDWMTLPLHPSLSEAQRQQALELIAGQIRRHKNQWDILDIRYCTDLPILESLQTLLKPITQKATVAISMPMPKMPLPNTVEGYHASRKRRLRKALTNATHKLHNDHAKQDFEFVVVPPGAETDAAIAGFFERHAAYWKARGIKTDAVRFPGLEKFYQAAAREQEAANSLHSHNHNRCRFVVSHLMLNNQIVSAHLGTWQGDAGNKRYLAHMCNYDVSFSRYRPGMIHFNALVEYAIQQGANTFDFGRGDEPYKAYWTEDKTTTWTLTLAQSRLAWLRLHADDRIQLAMGRKIQDPHISAAPEGDAPSSAVFE